MKVIATINGTMSAQNMALYALKYAEVQNLPLVLLHIQNPKDELADVEASVKKISLLASSQNVDIEYVLLQGNPKKALKNFISDIYVDIIFCSSRRKKNFITGSFSESLTKMDMNADIAIVHIVKISHIMELESLLLCIKEDRLSVKKFTFFATIASAYQAKGEIYSVSGISMWSLAAMNISQIREKLNIINFNLRHYIKLSTYMPFTLYIKHDFSSNALQSILTQIAKSNTQLVVIGGKRLSLSSLFKREITIEKLMRETSANIIVYYPKED